ncbi:FRG domain-containing protein [Corallococcus exiguus]|uniref:FRG domain-containing protein n=1 Tax=Corallococcus exiguus TaxID=83462 RepID=UPI001A8D1CCA|nr:FRG domain-containing protein [Corallococcus exiguus]
MPSKKKAGQAEVTVTSIDSLVDSIEKLRREWGDTIWYRGHAATNWSLIPTLMRPDHLSRNEMTLLTRFKQYAYPLLPRAPQFEWEWLFLMQHYGVPTRLLDWSESPLVALYFAVEARQATENVDGVIWCLCPREMNRISAGPALDHLPSFSDSSSLLDAYLPSRVVGVTSASQKPLAIVAPRQFARLSAQQGVFTIFHRNAASVDQIGPEPQRYARKFIVPRNAKKKLRDRLAFLALTHLSLFPDVENVWSHVKGMPS